MEKSLNILKEEDKIIIVDEVEPIELPYTPELWRRLDGEKTYDEDAGWLIDGIELETIIQEENKKEMENVFIGTIQVDGIDERRELYVVEEGDIYKVVGIGPDEEREDTEIISQSLKEVILKIQETWGSKGWDLQLSDEANELLQEADETAE